MKHFEWKNLSFFQKTGRFMAPVILQQLISLGINFLDNVMIGGFGETQIAAVSFGNQFYSLFNFICMGLGGGAVVLAARFWGSKELDALRRVAAIAMKLTVVLAVIASLAGIAFPGTMMRIFTNDTAMIEVGTPYMRLIGVTLLLAGLSSTSTFLLRSSGKVSVPFIGSAVGLVLNAFFNWVFIFGKLGAPRMELVGAGVGTVIARAVECLIIFGYFILKDDRVGFRVKHFLLPGGDLWKTYFKFGLPILISDTLLGVALTLDRTIQGYVGEAISAASSIVNSGIQITNIINFSMSNAAAIVVGHTIGEGDVPRAKREANTYVVCSLLLGVLMTVALLLLEQPYLSLFDITEETRRIAHGMLMVNCMWLPLQTVAYACTKGVLRAGGDTRFILFADSGTDWLISLPFGALAGLVWGLDPVIVYLILRVEYPLTGLICLIRFLSGKWLKRIPAKAENN